MPPYIWDFLILSSSSPILLEEVGFQGVWTMVNIKYLKNSENWKLINLFFNFLMSNNMKLNNLFMLAWMLYFSQELGKVVRPNKNVTLYLKMFMNHPFYKHKNYNHIRLNLYIVQNNKNILKLISICEYFLKNKQLTHNYNGGQMSLLLWILSANTSE